MTRCSITTPALRSAWLLALWLGWFAPRGVAVETVWIGGATGDWFDAANWSTGVVPQSSAANVLIDDRPGLAVTAILEGEAEVGQLTIALGDALAIGSDVNLAATTTTIAGELKLAGTVYVSILGSLTVEPTGEIAFAPPASRIVGQAGALLWNQGTIRGGGRIEVNGILQNDGLIASTVSSLLTINVADTGELINNGTLSTMSGESIEVRMAAARFVNAGIFEIGHLMSFAQGAQQSLEVVNAPGGVAHLGTGVGSLRLRSDGPAGTEVTFFNAQGALVVGGGAITLRDASGEDHVTTFRNAGVIRTEPASPLAQAAGINVLGGFEQLATGRLELGLKYAETGGYDRFVVNDGDAVLGGALAISLRDGFVPAIGDMFEILLADDGAVVGAFDAIEVPSLGPGRKWTLDYLPKSVVLGVAALEADFDTDGQTAIADLAVWQGGYGATGAMHSTGDADGDGLVDGDDFLAWQREFGQGAATIAAQRLVPEPASVALVATAVCALAGAGIRCGRNRDVKMRNTRGPRSVDPVR
ncbi:MAG: hypothetical protein KF847_00630 [Pirellulales bacterium]|nr:hypothetical protein [Pirellulales bacterium]